MRSGDELPYGDVMEVEIRGLSIHAVELLRQLMTARLKSKSSQDVVTSDLDQHESVQVTQDHHSLKDVGGDSVAKQEQEDLINSILIDFYLWSERRKKCSEVESAGIPFHKTRCIFY